MSFLRRKKPAVAPESRESGIERSRNIRRFELELSDAQLPIDGQASLVRSPEALIDSVRYLVNTRALAGEAPLPRRIGVTSSIRGEGTTSISHALATVLAEDYDAWVCWVDLSWARESPPTSSARPGLFDLFNGTIKLGEAFGLNDQAGYVALEAGHVPERSRHSLIRATGLNTLMDMLQQEFEYIIFDMPPVLPTNAGLPAFGFADAYVLVTHAAMVHSEQVERTIEQLAQIPHLGTILNGQADRVPAFLRRVLTR